MKKLLFLLLTFAFIIMPIQSNKFIIMGHRGASGYEPENTLRSFKRAMDMGVDMIELDVYLCKSGEVVVIHDDTIDRTTDGTGQVKELTYDQLKTYDAGKGERIPLLEEVFNLVNKKIIINIEIKDTEATMPVAELINSYIKTKNWTPDNFIVSSFDHQAISEFHKNSPKVKTGAIFGRKVIDPIELAKRIGASYAIIDYRSATKKLIDLAHKTGLKVFAYTVNSKDDALKLIKLNIDGIATNYPDILKLNKIH